MKQTELIGKVVKIIENGRTGSNDKPVKAVQIADCGQL